MVIYLGCQLPDTSSDHTREHDGPPYKLPYLVLLQVGFTEPGSRHPAGELLPHLSTLTITDITSVRRYISVALSLRSPSLGITQHSALRSSDFPQALCPRPSDLLIFIFARDCYYNIYALNVKLSHLAISTKPFLHQEHRQFPD